jgi:hypothetical protein
MSRRRRADSRILGSLLRGCARRAACALECCKRAKTLSQDFCSWPGSHHPP